MSHFHCSLSFKSLTITKSVKNDVYKGNGNNINIPALWPDLASLRVMAQIKSLLGNRIEVSQFVPALSMHYCRVMKFSCKSYSCKSLWPIGVGTNQDPADNIYFEELQLTSSYFGQLKLKCRSVRLPVSLNKSSTSRPSRSLFMWIVSECGSKLA